MRYTIYILFFTFMACGQDQSNVIKESNLSNPAVEVANEIDSFVYELPWVASFQVENTLINRVKIPEGYERISAPEGSFTHWLRRLPLHPGKPDVKLYNGEKKWNQNAHAYVLDLDVGEKDLQQCADAAMRLRAEYLYNNGKQDSIHFNYTNGATVSFKKWRSGLYPIPKSGKVEWKSSSNNSSYASFKKYMIQVFNYAGTLSLSRELKPVPLNEMQSGDLFLYGGSPGHAVMVMDVAVNAKTGDKVFLLAQSYMPAQEMHILKNPNNNDLSPWYSLSEIGETLNTPEWTFDKDALVRWN